MKKNFKKQVTKIEFIIDRPLSKTERQAFLNSLKENYGIQSVTVKIGNIIHVDSLKFHDVDETIHDVDKSKELRMDDQRGWTSRFYLTGMKMPSKKGKVKP